MNAAVRAVYGRQIPAKMQVEGQPTVYWKGLPITFTTCDYDSDEITRQLKTADMPANALPRTLIQMGFKVRLGDVGVKAGDP